MCYIVIYTDQKSYEAFEGGTYCDGEILTAVLW